MMIHYEAKSGWIWISVKKCSKIVKDIFMFLFKSFFFFSSPHFTRTCWFTDDAPGSIFKSVPLIKFPWSLRNTESKGALVDTSELLPSPAVSSFFQLSRKKYSHSVPLNHIDVSPWSMWLCCLGFFSLSLSLIDFALMAAVAQHNPVNSSLLRDPSAWMCYSHPRCC